MCIYVIMYGFKLSQAFTFLLSVSNFPFFGCFYIFTHVCMCIYVCKYTCTYVHVETRGKSWVSSLGILSTSFEAGSLHSLKLASRQHRLASEP